jgi:hypothetical protein
MCQRCFRIDTERCAGGCYIIEVATKYGACVQLSRFSGSTSIKWALNLVDHPRPWLGYLCGAIGLCLALIFFRSPSLDFSLAAMATAIILLGVAPGIWLLAQPIDRRPPFPLLAMTGGFYALFFGGSVFLFYHVLKKEAGPAVLYRGVEIDGISFTALLVVLVGLTVFYTSYAGAGYLLGRINCPRFRISQKQNGSATVILTWVLIATHLAYLVYPTFRSLPSVGQFIGPAGVLGLAIIYVEWRRKRVSWHHAAAAFLVFFPFSIAKNVADGYLTPIIMLTLAPLVLEFWLRGRVPWKSLIALFLIAVFAYPLMTPLRDRFWAYESGRPLIEKISLVAESGWTIVSTVIGGCVLKNLPAGTSPWETKTCKRFDDTYSEGYATLYNGLGTRMAHAGILSYVVDQTPKVVPFWNGETYKPLISSVIPRIIWSGKPEERAGNLFGRRYGFIEGDDQTSINMPWITELFANFGWPGIISGMAIFGALICLLERTLSDPSMTDLEVAIGLSILLPLFYQDSNFSVMTGSVIPYTICIWIYFTGGLRILKFVFPERPSK